MKFEGLEAWEYQNGVQLDVPNSLVYSKVEKVIKTNVMAYRQSYALKTLSKIMNNPSKIHGK